VVAVLATVDTLLQQETDLAVAEAAARDGQHQVEQAAAVPDIEDVERVGRRARRLGRRVQIGQRDAE
jgi:hypothetical protein